MRTLINLVKQHVKMWKFVDIGRGEKIAYEIEEYIISKKTKYQLLEIVRTKDFGNVLFLDGDPQSSELEEYIFNECIVHPAMMMQSKPKTVFIGGGGTGLTLREVLRYDSVQEVDIVDIDKEVVEICKKFYNYAAESFADPRVNLHHENARGFLANADSEKYDCVFLDTTMPHQDDIAAPLYRKEFFEIVKQKLKPSGVFVTAANSADFRYSKTFSSIIKTLQHVFSTVTPYLAYTPLFGQQWAFVFTSNNTADPSQLAPDKIDKKLSEEGCDNKLNFYDGITHQHMFSIDKKTRNMLKENGTILTDSIDKRDQIFVPKISNAYNQGNYVNIVDFSQHINNNSNTIKVSE